MPSAIASHEQHVAADAPRFEPVHSALHKCTKYRALGMWPCIGDDKHVGVRVYALPGDEVAPVQRAQKIGGQAEAPKAMMLGVRNHGRER